MNKQEETKKRKTIKIIIGVIFFALAYYGTQKLFKKNLELDLKSVALELNKQTPMKIDQFSILDSASAIGKTNLIYYYTLSEVKKTEVNIDTVNKYIRPNIIENVKNSTDLKIYRDNNITLDYKYYDKNGEFITEISVTPKLYKN
ncbi:hypothetical protein [Tenacibaculum aestuariivivum]|uniref:hypothetical protein n=1 Tax=Tenacibaculum aestuariivivum TaxID=2006131 RepID=UPI003AB261C5